MNRLSPSLHFLCVGVPRAGTSTLHALLQRHPQIGLPRGKELPILHRPDLSPEIWEKTVQAYWPAHRPFRGKCTPQYWTEPHLPRLLCQRFPEITLILSLRDPVARFWSEYRMRWRRGWESRPPERFVEDALNPQALNHARTRSFLLHGGDYAPYMALAGRYGELLERWWAACPPERWVVLFYETWTRSPTQGLALLWQRLGVAPPPSARLPRENTTDISPVAGLLARLFFALHRRVNPRPHLPLPLRARYDALLYTTTRHLRRRPDPPPPPPHLETRLREFYAPDMERLTTLIGRPLPWPAFSS
ncbi:MAG: sulfotransferase [Candidatus Hydrothermae bacterium]|nr:sulfotransferase [Candidatus Hydrothermae bacterium]